MVWKVKTLTYFKDIHSFHPPFRHFKIFSSCFSSPRYSPTSYRKKEGEKKKEWKEIEIKANTPPRFLFSSPQFKDKNKTKPWAPCWEPCFLHPLSHPVKSLSSSSSLSPTKSLRGSSFLMECFRFAERVFPLGVNEPEPPIQRFVSKWCPGGSRDGWRFRGPEGRG